MTEAEVLRIHTDSFYGALKSQDFVTLEKFYCDRYMLVRPDGSVLNKQQVLADLREHGLTFQAIDLQRQQVRVFGSVAILTGESRTVSSRNGNETRGASSLLCKRPGFSFFISGRLNGPERRVGLCGDAPRAPTQGPGFRERERSSASGPAILAQKR
jgi:ketosteroid isomerase-like protein